MFQFWFSISITFVLICSMRCAWFFRFLSASRVIRLSVNTCTVFSFVSRFYMFSSALSIASCSAWLFEHLPFSLYFILSILLPLWRFILGAYCRNIARPQKMSESTAQFIKGLSTKYRYRICDSQWRRYYRTTCIHLVLQLIKTTLSNPVTCPLVQPWGPSGDTT